jgi:hypothetical protein
MSTGDSTSLPLSPDCSHDRGGSADHEPPSNISEWWIFMLEDYCVKPSTVARVRASWLAPQTKSCLGWLEAHRYPRLVVCRRLPLLKELVEGWLGQHGAKAKMVVAVRKHAIDAECGVRQMLQLACKEPVPGNRRRRPFPLESEVPGFAEYLRASAETHRHAGRRCRCGRVSRVGCGPLDRRSDHSGRRRMETLNFYPPDRQA